MPAMAPEEREEEEDEEEEVEVRVEAGRRVPGVVGVD